MPTNFSVTPLGGFDIGSRTSDVMNQLIGERKRDILLDQAQGVLQTNDPYKISEFMVKNPEVAKHVGDTVKWRNDITKQNALDTLKKVVTSPEDPVEILNSRLALLADQGGNIKQTEELRNLAMQDPKAARKLAASYWAALDSKGYKAYSDALGLTDNEDTANIKDFNFYTDLLKTDPEQAKLFATQAGITKEKNKSSDIKNYEFWATLKADNPAAAEIFAKMAGITQSYTPLSDIGKLKSDYDNNAITEEQYRKKADKILNPTGRTKTDLTAAALRGDPEAKAILEAMVESDIALTGAKTGASTEAKLAALLRFIDAEGTAKAIFEGRETIENVKNTFGVPLQEMVRARVNEMAKESGQGEFNFLQPRATVKAINSSLTQQQKNRGAMGSFVTNINGQVDKLKAIADELTRYDARILNVPRRAIVTTLAGSGAENVAQAYMKEISAEIDKLSQGSTASVAQLPVESRKDWERIHDINLPLGELIKVLEATKEMANIRLKSVDSEIARTKQLLENVRVDQITTETPAEIPTIDTQEAFDALPSGAEFYETDENGKLIRYRKP